MTVRLTNRMTAAALLAIAFGAAPALAQNTPDQPATPPAQGQMPMQGQMQGQMPMQGQAQGQMPMQDRRMMRVNQHIAELHRRLRITPAEEPQWNTFAQVMRDNAMHMEQAFQARAQQGPNMSAVDDLKSYAAVAQAHAEDMQRLVPAFQSLYAALSPQQQKLADNVFRDYEERRERRPGG
jgi:hypothetical protein